MLEVRHQSVFEVLCSYAHLSHLLLCAQPRPGTKMSKDVVKQFRKTLNDMYREQKARFAEQMAGVLPPREADLQGTLNALDREKASDALANWDDPGRNHLPYMRLSNSQLDTICKYGLFDDAPAPRKNSFVVGPQLHFTVIAGLTMFMRSVTRSDTLLSLRMPSFFVMPCPGPSSEMENTLLCFCTDDVRVSKFT